MLPPTYKRDTLDDSPESQELRKKIREALYIIEHPNSAKAIAYRIRVEEYRNSQLGRELDQAAQKILNELEDSTRVNANDLATFIGPN